MLISRRGKAESATGRRYAILNEKTGTCHFITQRV